MNLVSASPDSVVVEFTTEELALLMTAMGRAIGVLEPFEEGESDEWLQDGLSTLHGEILGVLEASAVEGERVGVPFVVGEAVIVAPPFGPIPDIPNGTAARILALHPEDDTRDYDWCLLRLDDGREVALGQHDIRRVG